MKNYIGQKTYKIDAKGRISIPPEMRAGLGENFVASLGSGESLALYTIEDWESFMQKVDSIPNVDEREMLQFYYRANAEKLSLDGQGRLFMNEQLRERAFLKGEKEAVIFGNGEIIEIWNKAKFEAKYSSIKPADVRSILSQYGIH